MKTLDKRYAVRTFYHRLYYCGNDTTDEWSEHPAFAELFYSVAQAENLIKEVMEKEGARKDRYVIETVYV